MIEVARLVGCLGEISQGPELRLFLIVDFSHGGLGKVGAIPHLVAEVVAILSLRRFWGWWRGMWAWRGVRAVSE